MNKLILFWWYPYMNNYYTRNYTHTNLTLIEQNIRSIWNFDVSMIETLWFSV